MNEKAQRNSVATWSFLFSSLTGNSSFLQWCQPPSHRPQLTAFHDKRRGHVGPLGLYPEISKSLETTRDFFFISNLSVSAIRESKENRTQLNPKDLASFQILGISERKGMKHTFGVSSKV